MKMGKKEWRFLLLSALVILMSGAGISYAAESEFHGQFRINYYSLDRDDTGANQTAARLRWRPTWDATLPDDVKMHLQLNIGHITGNKFNAQNEQSGGPAVALRHAVLDFAVPETGGRINAGLVPLSDKFGDTLFSGDWDFNPVAVAWLGKAGPIDIRAAAGELNENDEVRADDQAIYLLDVDGGPFGASLYRFEDRATEVTQDYLGIRGSQQFGPVNVNAFVIYNSGSNDATTIDNSGYAAKLEATTKMFGIMALYATGDDGTGAGDTDDFVTPQQLYDGHGYWGYTGKLNIQGPTDTGVDNPLRLDGSVYGDNGTTASRGMVTVQAKAGFQVTEKFGLYAAVGHYRHAEAAGAEDEEIGNDVYLQGKYGFAENLNIEAGADYAMLSDNNKAYNYPKDQDWLLIFARLQLEY